MINTQYADVQKYEIWIIEDDKSYAVCLAKIINQSKYFVCSEIYFSVEQALSGKAKNEPDVIILDIELPGMSGVEGVIHFKKRWPHAEILMLTIHRDNDFVFNSLRNGANGYLLKSSEPKKILNAIREVIDGGSPMSMAIARMVVDSLHQRPLEEPLSRRQREVLQKLCEGKSCNAIARELFIEVCTVKFHIRNIYQALRVHNKAEAVAKAKDDHLI